MMNDYNDYYNQMSDMDRNAKSYTLEKDPYTAFVKGNSFKNLYDPYKNYKPFNVNPNNEREYSLLLVQTYGFIAHDLALYLDVNPGDDKAIQLREKYNNMYRQAVAEYEQKYGALSQSSEMLGAIPWQWDENNFPWEGDK